jgi:1,4-alpha-glucan branching enzyme
MFINLRDLSLFFLVSLLLIFVGCTGSRVSLSGPVPVSSGVLFRLFYPDAEEISIAGSFNNWDPMIHHLSENPEGLWRIVIPLPRGRYQYMFVIDRTVWIPDPGSEMTIEDGFGQKNSLLVVE